MGMWFNEVELPDFNRISKLQYSFKADNTIEVVRIELDSQSKKVLGYRYKSTGNFRIVGDQLFFSNWVSYVNDDTRGSYSALDDLQYVKEIPPNSTLTHRFEKQGQQLTFINPPCQDTFNCIGSQTFFKK